MTKGRMILYHLLRLSAGGIFLYAGAVKAADVTAFAGNVANYQILPYAWNYVVASSLPYVEILAGFLLVINRRVRPSAFLLGGLTVVFMVILASALARGLDIDCGCFRPGGKEKTGPGLALLRDAAILALLAAVYWLRQTEERKES